MWSQFGPRLQPRAAILLCLAACSSSGTGGRPPYGGIDAAADSGKFNPLIDAGLDPTRPSPLDAAMQAKLLIDPADMQVTLGLEDPSGLTYAASLSTTGAAAQSVKWSSDHAELGTIDRDSGVFKPSGVPGTLTVTAAAGKLSASTKLKLRVSAKQQGDPDAGKLPAGAGGIGGVGGEGGGSKLTDPQLMAALDAPATLDQELKWLYPYDGTVWPRGLPAPLLQWSSQAPASAVKIHIQVEDLFSYDGYFGAPAALAAGKPFTRLPIPQQVWRLAQAAGKTLKIGLTIAAKSGNGSWRARSAVDQTWTTAPTTLRGTVYYNSYGTKLAENFSGAMGGNGRFGGATLAIRGGSFDPTLVAGRTTDDSSGCRVCHTVSSDGSRMIAQQPDNMISSAYDLRDMNRERTYTYGDRGKFGWAALSPDGTLALGSAGPPGDNSSNVASLSASALYRVSNGMSLPVEGLSEFVTKAAMPAFSVDGKKLAFNFAEGPGTPNIVGDGRQIVVVDFESKGSDSYAIKNPRAVFSGDSVKRPGWPYFLPDGKGLVFQLELAAGSNGEHFATRLGARGELWWTDFEGHAHALDRANGKGYLPAGPSHNEDTTLQYEPTVAPLVAGGYAWVVFTSRRLYGNVATRDAFESDARNFDLSADNPNGPTTKKLWVSALDMPAKAGSDPSHPAFYLPAQELFAGNSRGFWVLDACKSNAAACGGGDECCGGYCRMTEEFTVPVCTDTPPALCANEYENCKLDTDCCRNDKAPLSCIAGRCAQLQLY